MANAHKRRSSTPEDVGGRDVKPAVPASGEQAEREGAVREREVPVTAGSEVSRGASSAATSAASTPAMAPPGAELAPELRAPQQRIAERVQGTFGQWGEQLGGAIASARRITSERARALTAPGGVHDEEARARHPSGSASAQHPAERWPDSPTMQRAEEVVNRMGGRVRPLASVIGRRAQRLFARAREEAEDIWAEAESMRARGPGRTERDSRTPED